MAKETTIQHHAIPGRRAALRALVALLGAATAARSGAQGAWPQGRPIKLIAAFSPGSASDLLARSLAPELARVLGATVVVDNRPGAGGTIAATALVNAPADGCTLLSQTAAHAVNPAVYPSLPYDTLKDIQGIAPFGAMPCVLVVAPAKGYRDVRDVVDRAKARPGALNYTSAGIGSSTHINAAKFAQAAGIDAVHVPSRGTAEALTEVMAGRVDWFFAPLASAVSLVKEGRLQALAVGSGERASALPGAPSMVEAGFSEAQYTSWAGVFVSARTPPAIVQRLHAAMREALEAVPVRERLVALGVTPMPMSAPQFDKFVADDVHAMAALVKSANLKLIN